MSRQGTLISVANSQDGETPRIVTESEPFPVRSGFGEIHNDAWGIPKVSLPVSLFHGLFTFDVPPSQWLIYENDIEVFTSTDITSSNSAGRLLTTATNTRLMLVGRECPRYQPNRGHLFSTALWCPDKTNDGIRDFGLFSTLNGVIFRLKADGLLYAVLISGGVETKEDLIDTSLVDGFDVEMGNVYDIQYQWRGVGNYKFFINLVLVHTFNNLGTLTALSMENPALPAHFRSIRITQDVDMLIGCVDITSENGNIDKEVYNSMYAESVSISNNTPVIVFHSPDEINGELNTRTSTLARISVNCSKKATFKVWVTRDLANITGATFKPLGNGSFIESDSSDMDATAVRSTSVTVANMRPITSIQVEALVRVSVDNPYRGRIEFPLVRGDYLVVTGSAAAGSADCVIEFGEQV